MLCTRNSLCLPSFLLVCCLLRCVMLPYPCTTLSTYYFSLLLLRYAVGQAVSDWPFTEEASVISQANPCGICGGQSGASTGFLRVLRFSPCQHLSTNASIFILHLPNHRRSII
jgi:hypothetical protein